ncbi:MAG: hypothetical protein JEZ12_12715 [Desulfobacterium sp.]|nr:hypothetical protein [Desulfobacterium sp.]
MKIIIMACLLICCSFQPLYAASNTHFPCLFESETTKSIFMIGLEYELQENMFPDQTERAVEKDSINENRIYTKLRSSVNSYAYAGVKAGFKFKSLPFFYLTAGYAEAEVDFNFQDTLTDNKYSYRINTTFESDAFPVYGGGISLQPYKKEISENHHLNLGLDLRYRYFDFDVKKRAGSETTEWYDMEYASKLHEVQLSLVAAVDGYEWQPFSGLTLKFTPYAGCKVSHFFADETFSDSGNIVTDEGFKNDPIYYEGDIQETNHISFFGGVGIGLTKNIILGLEARTGDEDGYACNVSFKF